MRFWKMTYNSITLNLPGKEEAMFREKYFIDSLFQFRLAFVLIIFLYSIFGYLDARLFPEYTRLLYIIRFGVVIPLFAVMLILSYTRLFQKIWQPLLLISLLAGGTGISLMTMLVPENYFYNAGLLLVFSAGYFFVKLRFFLATIGGWTLLLIYNIGALYFVQTPVILLITNNFFFISANIIGMVGAYNIEFYTRRSFLLNLKLDQERLIVTDMNNNLEKIVDERTIEFLMAKELAETHSANITAIIEGTKNSIWAFNRKYEILYINKEFQSVFHAIFGIRPEPGFSLIDSVPVEETLKWKSHYDRALSNEQFTIEEAIKRNGNVQYFQVTFNPIVKKGDVVGASCIGTDTTERKRSEIELLQAKEKAEESDRLKTAFLANMSHEIRTPMNGILGFADLLKEPNLSAAQQKEYIGIIEKSGLRMLNIINDIVDLSKIEAGLMKINTNKVHINEILDYQYDFFKPEIEAKGLKLYYTKSLPNEIAIIDTDREKVYAILTNLIKNAVKYSDAGSINFGYDKKDNFLEFYVKDTGIGIPVHRQVAIFDRFVQADIADTQARQGAGLGLSISKAYVEMLGGKIWVQSEEGKGSTFYFTLPFEVEHAENKKSDEDLSGEVKPSAVNSGMKHLKILIAEDDDVSQQLLSAMMSRYSREIFEVRSGLEAVEYCHQYPDLDLILMDIQLPDMNGYEATREIRKFNTTVIILAQTAYGLSSDRDKAIEAGCNDYIAKPIHKKELAVLVNKYFNVT